MSSAVMDPFMLTTRSSAPGQPPSEKDRRRLPMAPHPSSFSSSAPRARKPSPNHVKVQPASPDVISSLITCLSDISSPASSQFDASSDNLVLSRSTPSSPNHLTSSFSRVTSKSSSHSNEGSFGMDYGAYNRPSAAEVYDLLHPDEAALPPVIRTSKSSVHSAKSTAVPALHRSRSSASLTVPASRGSFSSLPNISDEQSSIGSLFLESVPPRVSTGSRESAEDIGRSTSTRRRSVLRYATSKEHLRFRDHDRAKAGPLEPTTANRAQGFLGKASSATPAGASSTLAESTICEEPAPETDSMVKGLSELPLSSATASSTGKIAPIGTGPARSIPARDSSLLKTGTKSPRKRRSHTTSQASGLTKENKESAASVALMEADAAIENGDVVRRIRELKARMEKGKKSSEKLTSQERPMNQSSPSSMPLETDEIAPFPAIAQRKPRGNSISVTAAAGADSSSSASRMSFSKINSKPNRLSRRSMSVTDDNYPRATMFGPVKDKSSTPFDIPADTPADDRPNSADSIDEAVDAYLNAPRLSQKVKHPQTGRVVSFSEVGDPKGYAVFCCLGMGLTRYITAFYDELAVTLKLRLITPERPGVGDSEQYEEGTGTPLAWPDDVYLICQALKITKFSILAHSAGAIYALATALRMPQHIRGRVHLLAPWIPPSQMSTIGTRVDAPPAANLPTAQRILRALPTPLLRAANATFMSATSASIVNSLPKSPRRSKRKGVTNFSGGGNKENPSSGTPRKAPPATGLAGQSESNVQCDASRQEAFCDASPNNLGTPTKGARAVEAADLSEQLGRQADYDSRLTWGIWERATHGANPAVDLVVCLERRQPIGFRYVDINRGVVIHHGSRDTRVPVENVKWLGTTMRRCEVRILEGEGHGLMASATVMGNVLMEIAKEWEDWMRVVQGKGGHGRRFGHHHG